MLKIISLFEKARLHSKHQLSAYSEPESRKMWPQKDKTRVIGQNLKWIFPSMYTAVLFQ